MPDHEHVALVRSGKDAIDEWRRRQRPNTQLDLTGANLSGLNLEGCNLAFANMSGADLTGANLNGANISAAAFNNANLTAATFCGATAERIGELGDRSVRFDQATTSGTTFDGARLWRPGFNELRPSQLGAANSFREVVFVQPTFPAAWLAGADFSGADLTGGNLTGADLTGADLTGAKLRRANLNQSVMTGASIAGADFFEAMVNGSDWAQIKGAPQAFNLEESDPGSAPKYFDHCERTWLERWCSWERLRTFGRLPLFGASWFGFAFVATYVYVIAWHNEQVRKFGKSEAPWGDWVGRHLHEMPIPSLTLLLFISTVLLAAASTIYSIFCPPRVREFSQEKWCDELQRPLLHYWPYAWRLPRLRLTCGVFYVTGASCAVVVIGWKIITTGGYILQNTKLW